MNLDGRRICIAGSASNAVSASLLRCAHEIVQLLAKELLKRGALLACMVGKNPKQRGEPDADPIIFDWDIINAISDGLTSRTVVPVGPQGRVLTTVYTHKTQLQIPKENWKSYDVLEKNDAISIYHIEPGWTSGAARRTLLANQCDILIVLGGGEGVEDFAQKFRSEGKPVIPLDLDLGSSMEDGDGGAKRLNGKFLSAPDQFCGFEDRDAVLSAATQMASNNGTKKIEIIVHGILALLENLLPPTAFFVRLLDANAVEHQSVERYFRYVVTPAVKQLGFSPVQMGITKTESPWMNVQIFESIHKAGIVVADLTGLRPNCFMEMGYAFGRLRKVIVTARNDTIMPFDMKPIEYRSWDESSSDSEKILELIDYWERNSTRMPLASS